MSRPHRVAAALATTALASLLVPLLGSTPVHAAGPVPVVPPAVDYLSRGTIHTAAGTAVHVPVPSGQDFFLHLLAPTHGGGWLVLDDHGAKGAWVATLHHGRLHRVRTVDDSEGGDYFLAAPDGRHVVELDEPDTRHTDAYVYASSGGRPRHVSFRAPVDLVGFDGRTAWFTDNRHTWEWTPGSPPAVIATAYSPSVDPAHDVLWISSRDFATVGPTSLTAPGTPSWTIDSDEFQPRTMSADGTLVAGLDGDGKRIEIRSMADGSLVSEWKLHLDYSRPLLWEPGSGHAVLSVLRSSGKVVRCTAGGDCDRATTVSGYDSSLPFQITHPGLGGLGNARTDSHRERS